MYFFLKSCICTTSVDCKTRGTVDPLDCDKTSEGRAACPIQLPCLDHGEPISGYINHLTHLISGGKAYREDVCIVIPCDSIEAWIVAAFDKSSNSETIENPWESVISRKKTYHDIRVRGSSKNLRNFAEFAGVVCENWSDVTRVCRSLQINLRITLDGTCAISRKWAGNEKALKSQDFKAFYMVEISGIEPLTS